MGNPQIDRFGTQKWYDDDGQLHRTDGPAELWPNGDQWWCCCGKMHRTDGPAEIWSDGDVEWWLNDKHYTFGKWLEQVDVSDESKVMLKLQYG